MRGYAAAVYLRVQTSTCVYYRLVISQLKVSPLKRCTISRLKLYCSALAVKLFRIVINIFTHRINTDETQAWTVASTTLVWICSSPLLSIERAKSKN